MQTEPEKTPCACCGSTTWTARSLTSCTECGGKPLFEDAPDLTWVSPDREGPVVTIAGPDDDAMRSLHEAYVGESYTGDERRQGQRPGRRQVDHYFDYLRRSIGMLERDRDFWHERATEDRPADMRWFSFALGVAAGFWVAVLLYLIMSVLT